eukprot:3254871-Rhodomonas_salina.1
MCHFAKKSKNRKSQSSGCKHQCHLNRIAWRAPGNFGRFRSPTLETASRVPGYPGTLVLRSCMVCIRVPGYTCSYRDAKEREMRNFPRSISDCTVLVPGTATTSTYPRVLWYSGSTVLASTTTRTSAFENPDIRITDVPYRGIYPGYPGYPGTRGTRGIWVGIPNSWVERTRGGTGTRGTRGILPWVPGHTCTRLP